MKTVFSSISSKCQVLHEPVGVAGLTDYTWEKQENLPFIEISRPEKIFSYRQNNTHSSI